MYSTYNYSCINPECGSRSIIRISKDNSLKDRDEFCKKCGKSMKILGEVYNCVATFDSKSSEEKKSILKRRADEHNKTKMKDRVPEVRKRILGGS